MKMNALPLAPLGAICDRRGRTASDNGASSQVRGEEACHAVGCHTSSTAVVVAFTGSFTVAV
eukprot:COSAG06_NODE_26587_length_611_cov_1.521484_1_plen_61_part_01